MAKKNYKKFLPKVGGTMAVAVAMTMALSTQVSASELDNTNVPKDFDLPENTADTQLTLELTNQEPVEHNEAVEKKNEETTGNNSNIAADNEGAQQKNEAAIEENKDVPAGNLPEAPQLPENVEAPQLPETPDAPEIPELSDAPEISGGPEHPGDPDLPEVDQKPELPGDPNLPAVDEEPEKPNVPNTEGMDPADHNDAAEDYNEDVNDYNEDVKDYNDKAEDYNDAVKDYNEEVKEYNDKAEDYNDDVKDFNDAAEDYNKEAGEYNDAIKDFNEEIKDFNDEAKDYNDDVKDYNDKTEEYEDAVGQYNDAVGEYNEKVDDYNDAVDEYNEKVDDYNEAAEAYDKAAQEKFEEDLDKAEEQHNAAEEKMEADLEQQAKNDAAEEAYQQEKSDYDKAAADYLAALEKYEAALTTEGDDSDARQQYLQDKAAYDKAHADYLAALEQYNSAVEEHDPGSAAYQQYLQDKAAYDQATADYLAALDNYNNVLLPQYETDSAAYQQYLQDKATYDEAYAKYLDELYKYNNEILPGYEDKTEQSETEKNIIDDVNKYNQEVAEKNGQLESANAAMKENIDVGVADNLEGVGALNANVVIDAETKTILGSFKQLEQDQIVLNNAGAALATHPGKDAPLGSDEYAAYLKAVEDHNALVDEFNEKIAAYNAAVDAYNVEVEKYNQNKPEVPGDATTDDATQQTGGSIDWGNVNMGKYTTVNHVDVKYQAAASKDVQKDENGKPTLTDNVTGYTVTGVYADEETAIEQEKKPENQREYGLTFDNDGAGTQKAQVQELLKSSQYQEFGIDHNKLMFPWWDPDFVVPNLNPATGTVSFRVTLKDSDGETHGIDVNLNAASVYAEGSYYKAKFNDEGKETDFLNQFYTVDKDGKKQYLPVVEIPNENGQMEKYYNISGQSVFLISALTCDGMTEDNGKLNPNGLDLVLNLQTMIENHQSKNAKKLGYKTFELEKYKAVDENNLSDPGKAPEAPTFNMADVTPVAAPERPDAPIYDPGDFDRDSYEAPAPVARLERLNKLDRLEEKVVIDFGDPVEEVELIDLLTPVTPVETLEEVDILETLDEMDILELLNGMDLVEIPDAPVNPPVETPDEPVVVNDHFAVDFEIGAEIEIPDEEVPLAAAPKTGDISSLWTILSGFSAAGFFMLGRKRKEEE